MTESKGGDAAKSTSLSDEDVAVVKLVNSVPAPRTADELAASYAGLQVANLWPEQSEKAVRGRIDSLLKSGKLKKGDKTPNGEPVIEIAKG